MKSVTIILMILGVMQTRARAEEDLRILAPPRYVGTGYDHLYLVGTTTAPIVEVRLNGEIVRTVPTRDTVFHALVSFGYGLNEITVTPVYGDSRAAKAGCDTITVLSGPDITEKYRRLFTAYFFHGAEPREDCLGCHASAPDTNGSQSAAEQCYDCHRTMRERFRTHIPRDDRACAACHSLGRDFTLVPSGTYSDKNPCYSCHKDKIGQFTQDYIHGPVAGGSCTICHDPHGSVFANSLVNPVPVLCPSCHDQTGAHRLEVQHPPFAEGRCVACHDPHATNHKWVLVKKSQELCIPCHRKIGTLKRHEHPYNVAPKRRLASPLELTENGRLECISCHEAHAGNTEHLLRTEKRYICVGCHPDR